VVVPKEAVVTPTEETKPAEEKKPEQE